MLAEGIAFIALRRKSLYHAQLPTRRDSPVHQREVRDVLRETRVSTVMRTVSVSGIPIAARQLSVRSDADLRTAAETMLANKLREIQVTDAAGTVIGLLDEADISRFYLKAAEPQPPTPPAPPTDAAASGPSD
jgi:CIC family chloride channel protein